MKVSKNGFTVFVNNGDDQLQDANVSLSWGFSKELCDISPQHIAVVVHHENDMVGDVDSFTGKRYLCHSEDSKCFLQFTRPGVHRVVVILFDYPGKFNKKSFFGRKDHNHYENFLLVERFISRVDKWTGEEWDGGFLGNNFVQKDKVFSVIELELDIPSEFFVERAKNPLIKAVNHLSNVWHRYPPVDQCEQRKRVLLSLFGKLWLVLLGRIVMVVLSLVETGFAIIAWILTPFFGYRPVSIFDLGIWSIWRTQVLEGYPISIGDFLTEALGDLTKYSGDHCCRTWRAGQEIVNLQAMETDDKLIRLPIAPFGLALVAVSVYTLLGSFGFFTGLLSFVVLVTTLWLFVVRLWKPFHKHPNHKFWGHIDEHSSPAEFLKLITSSYFSGVVKLSILAWVGFYFHDRIILGLETLLISLAMIASAVLVFFFLKKLARKFSKSSGVSGFFKGKSLFRVKPRDTSKQEEQERERVEKEQALKLERWQRSLEGGSNLEPVDCEACEPQTVRAKLRLVFWATKSRVCKPYAR